VLTNDPSVQTIKSIKGKLVPVKYWNSPINAGMSIHVGNGMQFLTATIETTDNGEVEISLQKPLVYLPGDKATVMYLNGGNLRVVGTIQLA
jgi:hypothetical protein